MNKKKEEKVKNILKYRIRGYSLSAVAQIFKYKSREAIRLIIKQYRNELVFKDLYIELDKTLAFLNRKF